MKRPTGLELVQDMVYKAVQDRRLGVQRQVQLELRDCYWKLPSDDGAVSRCADFPHEHVQKSQNADHIVTDLYIDVQVLENVRPNRSSKEQKLACFELIALGKQAAWSRPLFRHLELPLCAFDCFPDCLLCKPLRSDPSYYRCYTQAGFPFAKKLEF